MKTLGRPVGSYHYPWDKWLLTKTKAGNPVKWRLEQGRDFFCKIGSMIYLLRYRAKVRGLSVRVELPEEGVIVFQVNGPIRPHIKPQRQGRRLR